jgi:hypothetical protein
MKKTINVLIISLFFTNFYTGIAQPTTSAPKMPIDKDTKLITYKEVVKEQGSKDELYTRAIEWLNSFYKNPLDVTKVRDKENGKIQGLARMRLYITDKDGDQLPAGIVSYKINLELKDARYRYTITDFNVKKQSKFPLERWMDKKDNEYTTKCDSFIEQVDKYTKNLIINLKKSMKPVVKKKDEW